MPPYLPGGNSAAIFEPPDNQLHLSTTWQPPDMWWVVSLTYNQQEILIYNISFYILPTFCKFAWFCLDWSPLATLNFVKEKADRE